MLNARLEGILIGVILIGPWAVAPIPVSATVQQTKVKSSESGAGSTLSQSAPVAHRNLNYLRGRLGGEYIDQLDQYLLDFLNGRSGHLEQILERATVVKKARHEVFFMSIGHTFPAEIPAKQRSRGVMHVISQGWGKGDYRGGGGARA